MTESQCQKVPVNTGKPVHQIDGRVRFVVQVTGIEPDICVKKAIHKEKKDKKVSEKLLTIFM